MGVYLTRPFHIQPDGERQVSQHCTEIILHLIQYEYSHDHQLLKSLSGEKKSYRIVVIHESVWLERFVHKWDLTGHAVQNAMASTLKIEFLA